MVRPAAAALWVSTLLKLTLVTFAGLWPIRDRLWHLKRYRSLVNLYTLPDSNLDVLALAWLHTGVLLVLLAHIMTPQNPPRGYMRRSPPFTRVRLGIRVLGPLVQLLLLAKAVAVAVWGREEVLPPDPEESAAVAAAAAGRVGLLCMFASIVGALVGSFVEQAAARSLASSWRRRWRRRTGATRSGAAAPLLGGDALPPDDDDENASESHKGAHGDTPTVSTLVRMASSDTPILALAFAAGAAAALGQALIPYYTGRIIDAASIDPDPAALRRFTLRLLGVAGACAAATGLRGGLFTVAMTRLNVRLRAALFASLLAQEAGFYDGTRTGDITSRLSADTTTVSDQVCLNLNIMLRSLTQAAVVLAFMFDASWRLTVVTFVMVPLVLAICKVYGSYYRKLSKRVQSELAEANSVAEEALSSMTTVKAHAAEDSTRAAYAAKLARFYSLQLREAAAYALYMATNTFLGASVVAGVLFYGGRLVLAGSMSAGALVSFMLYQQSLSGAFQALGDVFSALAAAVGAADKPGEVVALVGPSGGGKSSVVKLVERLYLPSAGAVKLDGLDVGAYDAKWLKRRVALVSQEPVLYARSVARNIAYGLEPEDDVPQEEVPTLADIHAAARLANAHDFILALPDGYDTECGDRGVQLSGGQKQRIALARALVRKPAVLLLDEATSALDADSEALVQEALDATMRGRTVLVIAHRLSTVRNADRILVIQGGAVVSPGAEPELPHVPQVQ
ncbi:ATP-binding cassette sub-family B member 9 [Auxenochlorella protothecoides]|uniref:ATP-binding cassette sub-family B member 9 n=1 Tax=Auxenochlorella protothecoides TaxID=3075 RepID=A0A087SKD7_AUXPR|nr:ATP-binding cassette sub-family B member 9 [Auxenochlorella protothecoides]KFM26191.1 ATP-binding cassette sub-family B member 9 [Auxenochlorella protothecoides]